MTHALGFEIVDFYMNGWPENHFVDDYELTITDDGKIVAEDAPNHAPSLPLEEKYALNRFGFIYNEKTADNNTFAYYFKKWKKDKTTTTILIEVPKEHEETIRLTLSQDERIKIIK